MANIAGDSLKLVDQFIDDGSTLLDGPAAITSIDIGGTTFVYVSAANDDAVQIFTMAADGNLTPVGSISDLGGTSLDNTRGIAAFEIGGNPFLAVTGLEDDGITTYALTDTSPFATFADAAFDTDNAAFELNGAISIRVLQTGSGTFLYVAGFLDDGIAVFSVNASGTLTSVQNIADDATLELDKPYLSEVFEASNGDLYLVASGEFDDGLTVFGIDQTTGELTALDSLDGDAAGLEFNATSDAAMYEVDGTLYIYQGVIFDDALTVLRYDPSGSTPFTEVQTLQSTGLLNGPFSNKVVSVGDRAFLVQTQFISDNVLWFEIDSTPLSSTQGQLTLIDNRTVAEDGVLDDVRDAVPVEVDGTTFLVAAGINDDGLNVYEIGGGDDVLNGTQRDDIITGGAGDDIIYGFAGADEIDGGNDDDVIYAGSGIDKVFASNGFDRTFGGSNFDTFDAGFFDGSSTGVQIDTAFDLFRTPGGFKQFISGFERLHGTDMDDDIRGDDANNDLRGFNGDDVLNGRGGNDSLRGGSGEDRLLGVNGDDFLFGGNDDDDLRGGAGNDRLNGDAGDDFMIGEAGDDTLNGGRGNDAMRGNSGADTFFFEDFALSSTEFDIVRDFTDGVDVIALSGFGFADATEALAGASQRSWGVRWQLDSDQVVSLENVSLSDLSGADLIL